MECGQDLHLAPEGPHVGETPAVHASAVGERALLYDLRTTSQIKLFVFACKRKGKGRPSRIAQFPGFRRKWENALSFTV